MYVIDVEDLSVQRAGRSGAQVFTIPGASESSRYPLWFVNDNSSVDSACEVT
jgi:hypothetical protein